MRAICDAAGFLSLLAGLACQSEGIELPQLGPHADAGAVGGTAGISAVGAPSNQGTPGTGHGASEGAKLPGIAEGWCSREDCAEAGPPGSTGGAAVEPTPAGGSAAWASAMATGGADGDTATTAEDPAGLGTNERFAPLECDAQLDGPAEAPSWCPELPVAEACGNCVDDDCDGTVDEHPLLNKSCRVECAADPEEPSHYRCDGVSNTVRCVPDDLSACLTVGANAFGCGNGFVEHDEDCDYAAFSERLGVTCNRDCQPVRFNRCVFGTKLVHERIVDWCEECVVTYETLDVRPEECADSMRCVTTVGACLPTRTADQLRCPRLPMEPPLGCGNGVVDHSEECEPGQAVPGPNNACAWNCQIVPADDERAAPSYRPALPMLEIQDGPEGPVDCRISCSDDEQCPSSIPQCYMGYCVAPI